MNSIQANNDHILLLDSGNTCPIIGEDPKARTDIILKAMETMGYTALNAGSNEICCPQSILNRGLPTFPVLSSNLVRKDMKKPTIAPFVIKSVGAIRVGILGVLPVDTLNARPDSAYMDQYDIISPELAINKYLPGLKQKTDLIILLSQCSPATTRRLIQKTEGINIAIVSGRGDKSTRVADDCENDPAGNLLIKNEPVILGSGRNGTTIGYLKVIFQKNNDKIEYHSKTIRLDKTVAEDPGIKSMIGSFLHDPLRLKRLRTLQNREHRNEIETLQQLSPEEYIKTLQK